MRQLLSLLLLFPTLLYAVDEATVTAIDSKATSANAKADGLFWHVYRGLVT